MGSKEGGMTKKKDIWLLLGALLLAGILLLVSRLTISGRAAAGVVRIYVDGRLYREEALGAERDIQIEQEGGETNILRLTEDGFYMAYSTCHNQLCVQQGPVTADNYITRALGTRIICLPNKVSAELVLAGRTPPPDAPDI